ncbi:MAG: hypothetical protein ACJAZO_002173 [Myxococcota bacterium]|jgi:hypothetical protein
MNTRKSTLTASLLLGLISTASANDGLQGANIVALGGASVANHEDNVAIAANPAMLALKPRYDLSGTVFGQLDGDLGWNLNAVDSSKGIFAFGAGWERVIINPPLTDDDLPGWTTPSVTPTNRRKTSIFHIAASVSAKDRLFSFGVSGTMGTVSHDRLGKQLTGDLSAGFGLRPSDNATFGLVAHGLLPIDSPEAIPVSTVLGARYGLNEGPSIALDVGWQFEDPNGLGLIMRVGAEGAVGMARPRLGFSYDGPERQTALTGGIGADNPAGAVDFGAEVPLGPDFSGKQIRAVLTLRLRT